MNFVASLIYYVLKIASLLLYRLPVSWQMKLGNLIGWLWFDVLRIRRRIVLDNIRRAFPEWSEEKRLKVARASMHHMGKGLVEFLRLPALKRKDFDKFYEIRGLEIFEQARQQKKGVLLLTLHMGGADFALNGLAMAGLPIHLITKEFKSRWLNLLWFRIRGRFGIRFISDRKSSFDILRALNKNESVMFVLDQYSGPPIGVETEFFGYKTGAAMGLAVFAGKTGAPVLPLFAYRTKDHRTVLTFEPEIAFQNLGDRKKNIQVMTQVYTDKIEEIIRQYPDQWMWVHRRWKPFIC